jgi:Domain of unknown function (DUF4160)
MPTLKRFGRVSIRIYADDHSPPHIHIIAPDFHVLVRISDWSVIAGDARKSDIAKALIWAKKHRDIVRDAWEQLNERG